MCNLSSGILEKGKAEGIAEGRIEGRIQGRIESLYYDGNNTPEEIAIKVNLSIEYVKKVLGIE